MTRYLVGGALIGLAVIGAVVLPKPLANAKADALVGSSRVIPVNVAVAQRVDSVEQLRDFTGTVKARRESQLAFERPGRVIAIVVDEGARVTAGQLLGKLDVDSLRAQREAAEASLSQAKAVLSELEAGPRKQTIAASKARVRSLTAVASRLEKDLNRAKNLRGSRAISQGRFDTVQFQWEGAMSELDAAQKRLDELEAGTRVEQIEAQRAIVKSMAADVKRLDLDIEDGELRAPFAGRIAERLIDEGTVVSAGSVVLHLVEDQSVEAWIGLPSTTAMALSVGDVFELEIGSAKFEGKLTSLRPRLDPVTRTRNAIFKLAPVANGKVVPGQIARLQIEENVDCVGYRLPTTALVAGPRGLWNVYTVDTNATPHVVKVRSVELLYTLGQDSVVSGTLSDADAIIVDGTHRIVSDQTVEARWPAEGTHE